MLYLVATPIGNLGDITLRALEVLRSVDFVISEDTRKTGTMLKHFEIKKPQLSFHEYNEQRVLPKIPEQGSMPCDSTRLNPFLMKRPGPIDP